MQIAFLFPGQGSQAPWHWARAFRTVCGRPADLREADEALGFSISGMCFAGTAEELQLTANTQPAILACSVAAYRVLSEKGINASCVAGHSLGEYSALVAAGSLRFADALRIVRHRGQYMQEAVPLGTGAMAALIGLSREQVEDLCIACANGEVVSPANFNSPGQIVVAGSAGAVQRLVGAAPAAGAKKAVLLKVSAPFHCSLMRPAQQRLAPESQATPFADLRVPLINNVRAEEVRSGAAARRGLMDQIPAPVLWEDCIRRMLSFGVQTFVEVGPAR